MEVRYIAEHWLVVFLLVIREGIKDMRFSKINLLLLGNSLILSIIIMLFLSLGFSNRIDAVVLLAFMMYQLVLIFRNSKNIFDMDFVFTLVWFTSMSLSVLQLHPVQVNWSITSWICFLGAYVFYLIGSLVETNLHQVKNNVFALNKNNTKISIYLLLILISVPFIIEVLHSGIPAFSGSMSAYKDFAMPIIHYLTVSCVLLPPFIIFYFVKFETSFFDKIIFSVIFIYSITIPILIVSRQLIILALILSVLSYYFASNKTLGLRNAILLLCVLCVVWLITSGLRNQNEDYLNTVFEYNLFKINLPLSLKNVYSYIAWNFDNFNYNIQFIEFKFGKNFLEPFLSFFGARKFLPDDFFSTTLPNIFETYTTMPITYNGYQDFGILGVFLYMCFIGYICQFFKDNSKLSFFNFMEYALCIYGLAMSFFTSFFSSTNFWAYLIILIFIKHIVSHYRIKV